MPGSRNKSAQATAVWLADDDMNPLTQGVSYEDQQVQNGLGYTVSTQVMAVNAANYLITELANAANSGVNFIMTSRVMTINIADGSAPAEYSRYNSASVIPGSPTTATINNRLQGGASAPGTFRYVMASTLPTGGAATSGGFLPTGGEEKRIKEIVIIPPGGKLIYTIGGAGGGLAATARIVATFLFYTRPV